MPYAHKSKVPNATLAREGQPDFIRRCGRRNLMGRAPSEKLGRAVSWSTASQGRIVNLLEVTHSIVAYEPWPFKVTLRAGWNEAFEYWPAMGFTCADGSRGAIDVVHDRDLSNRVGMNFDQLLKDALTVRGVRLVLYPEISLATDRKVMVARQMSRYVGTSVPDMDADLLRQMIGGHGGRMTLGQIKVFSADGAHRMAQACVLGMRRRLRLDLDSAGLEQSTVSLCGTKGDDK